MAVLKARPSESEKEPLLVFMTAVRMLDLKLVNGDLCHLVSNGSDNATHAAIAWTSSRPDMKDGLVGISKWLQERSQVKLGSEVSVTKSDIAVTDASNIVLKFIGDANLDAVTLHWAYIAKLIIPEQHRYVTSGQRLFLTVGKHRHEFEIVSGENQISKISETTEFIVGDVQGGERAVEGGFNWSKIGGLDKEITSIENFVQQLLQQYQRWLPGFSPRHGVLLYGPKGTGKTLFRNKIAEGQCWRSVERWKPNVHIKPISGPRLIQIDLHDKLTPSAIIDLLDTFKSIENTSTLLLGEVEHPNDVDKRLRGVNAFEMEIELPVPNVTQRRQILSVISQGHLKDDLLDQAAEKTHGYVGEDLQRFLNAIWDSAISRTSLQHKVLAKQSIEEGNTNGDSDLQVPDFTISDLDQAINSVRPSALQEVFLEKPNVRWDDIGGQHDIKRDLQNAIEWPLKFPEKMKFLGLDSTKGVLLYGPPGCSKTLLVKALANEADVNFLAVKGAELISMYVGESERATREVFRKARAASPCIIFFDEIDAIASRSRSGNDLNVLTTLLNEMDGFEELRGVLVVAATNKPQSIDPALMRPGRFDNVVYIGLPDAETRKEILRKRFERFSYHDEVKSNLEDYTVKTQGFSGAEVVAVCKTAAKYAFSSSRDLILPQDMDLAIMSTPKSITIEMLDEYESWNAARRI